jgi:peptide chain release factor
MILLQLSAGQGPLECCRAVGLALEQLERECNRHRVRCTLLEEVSAHQRGCYKSVLLKLDANNGDLAKQIAYNWQGAMLWVCQSQFRPKHKRKNWYFSGHAYEFNESQLGNDVTYQTCRASGAGGQHVNKTDSAVRAIHQATGLSVRVESERSQHANKRVARALLFQRLEYLKQEKINAQEQSRWQQHWELERGNPKRTFKGVKFALVR